MIVTIADLRRAARRRLPRALFDYIDGAAEDEVTMRANRVAFERLAFCPRPLVDVTAVDLSVSVLGERLATPLLLAPAGLTGMFWPQGEIAAARAAARCGTRFVLSTLSVAPVEEVARAAPGPLWFQLYVLRNRGLTRELVERARAAGCSVLCLTIDVPTAGARERDLRNGFTIPPRVTPGNVLDLLQRPAWVRGVLPGLRTPFGNFTPAGRDSNPFAIGAFVMSQFDPSLTWADVDWLRGLWSGPLVLKGIMSPEAARHAVDHGADAVIVSNHGGRQLDGLPASLDVLPEVIDAVGDEVEVILDSGIRRGSDVVKAMALGARACMIGRPYLYGLAAGGQAGVERALDLLVQEATRTLMLLGCQRLSDLDRSFIRTSSAVRE